MSRVIRQWLPPLVTESGGGAGGGPWVVAGAGGAVLATVSVAAAVCCYCRRRAPARRTHLHCNIYQLAPKPIIIGNGCSIVPLSIFLLFKFDEYCNFNNQNYKIESYGIE